MQVRLRTGEIAEIPDGLPPEETIRYLDKLELPKPSIGGWVGGALGKGAERTGEMMLNVASLFTDVPDLKTLPQPPKPEFMRAYEAYQPDLGIVGQLATGALEFVPQIPFYSAVGGPAVGGVKGAASLAHTLLTPRSMVLKDLAGAATRAAAPKTFAQGWGRAIAEAAGMGGATGLIAGTPAGTPMEERLATAGEEALGFAGATAGLYPVGKVIGATGRALFTKGQARRARANLDAKEQKLSELASGGDEAAQAQLDLLRIARKGKAEPPAEDEGHIVIGPEEEELKPLKVNKNDLKRFKRLGYTRADLVGMEGGEFTSILKERRKKGDTKGGGGLEGPQRGWEEFGRTLLDQARGPGAAEAGGNVQAHEGEAAPEAGKAINAAKKASLKRLISKAEQNMKDLEGTPSALKAATEQKTRLEAALKAIEDAEVEAADARDATSFQKLKVGRDPAKVEFLLRAGYQPKEIRKMKPEAFESAFTEARASEDAYQAERAKAKEAALKLTDTIQAEPERKPIGEAFGPTADDVKAKEDALRLMDEAAERRSATGEAPTEEDLEETLGELRAIFDAAPEAQAPVKVATEKVATGARATPTLKQRFETELANLEAEGEIEVAREPLEKGKARRARGKVEAAPTSDEDKIREIFETATTLEKPKVILRKAGEKPPQTKEDFEKLLAEEGMPEELPGEGEFEEASMGESLKEVAKSVGRFASELSKGPKPTELPMFLGGLAESFKRAVRAGSLPEGAFSALHDRKVRWEISDMDARVTPAFEALADDMGIALPLKDAISHPELLGELPKIRDVRVIKFKEDLFTRDTLGGFNPEENLIAVNSKLSPEEATKTILHEIQHWIQFNEGWAGGGNPEGIRLILQAASGLEKLYSKLRHGAKLVGPGLPANSPTELLMKWQLARQVQADRPKIEAALAGYDAERQAYRDNLAELEKLLESAKQQREALWKEMNSLEMPHLKDPDFDSKHAAYRAKLDELYAAHSAARAEWSLLSARMHQTKMDFISRDYDISREVRALSDPYRKLAYEAYRLIAGEAESRSTEARKSLDMFTRSSLDPYAMADAASMVPVSDWVVLQDGRSLAKGLMMEKVKVQKKTANTEGAKTLMELEDGKTLKEIPPAQQASRWRQVIFTPLETNKVDALADARIFDLVKAELFYGHTYAQHRITIDDAMRGLSKEERPEVRKVLEGAGTKNVKVFESAQKVRGFLDMMRDRYKQHLREQYAKHLSPEEQVALRELIQGVPLDMVKAKHQYTYVTNPSGRVSRRKNIDPPVLDEIAKEYRAIDQWGLDDYVPNFERGRYKMLVDGKLIGVGLSRSDAQRKAIAFWKLHPEKKTIYIDTEFSQFDPEAVGLSRNQYYAIQNSLKKAINEKIEGLSKGQAMAMAERAMGGKFAILPSQKFSPYVKPRHEILQGEEDIFPILKHYAYSMEKKMALDPVLEDIRRDSGKIRDPQIRENLLSLAEDVKGQYWFEDKVADSILGQISGVAHRWLGKDWEPAGSAFTRFVGKAKQLETNLKLAYRPIAGVINFASGQGHIWVKFGAKNLIDGWKFAQTPEGKALIEELRPMLGETFVDEGGGVSLYGPLERAGILKMGSSPYGNFIKNLAEPLGMFSAAEVPNREVAALTSYLVAKAGGKSEKAAKEFALRSTWFTEFTYNTASLGQWMRRPIGRLLFQFKPYLVKELEFIGSLRDPAEIARYVGMQVALAGPRGFIMLMRTVPILSMVLPVAFWDKIEEWANTNAPRLSRGVGGALGVDVTAPAMFQFPSKTADWLGPLASDLSQLKKLWDVFVGGEDMSAGDATKALTSTIPVLRQWGKAIDMIVDRDGWVKDDRGRNLYHIDNPAAYLAKTMMAAEDLTSSQIRTEERILATRESTIAKNKQKTIDRVLDRIEEGKVIDPGLMEDMVHYNIQPSSLRRAQRFRELDAKTRRMLMTEIIRRPEIQELYPEIPLGQ